MINYCYKCQEEKDFLKDQQLDLLVCSSCHNPENYNPNYYLEEDLVINSVRETHIGAYCKLSYAPMYEEPEKVGLILCNNQVSFLGGIDYGGLDLDNNFFNGICPTCVKKYHELIESNKYVKELEKQYYKRFCLTCKEYIVFNINEKLEKKDICPICNTNYLLSRLEI